MGKDGFPLGLPPRGVTDLTRSSPSIRGKAKRVKLRAREHARLQCENLELDIMNLRQEIATLSNLRQLLYERTLHHADATTGSGRFEKVVREYYALAADGFYDVVWRKQKHSRASEPVDMLQFMRTCFDASLAIGDRTVRPAQNGLENYWSLMYEMMAVSDSPKVRILQTQVGPGDTKHHTAVEFQTRCASILNPLLLDTHYPHLQQVGHAWLREKLIGKKLVTIADGTFVFDKRTGLVVRVDLRIDQAASILKLAESLEELHILKKAPIRFAAVEETDESKAGASGMDQDSGGSSNSERTSKVSSTESLSPMSLRHVLSPERDHDDEDRAAIA